MPTAVKVEKVQRLKELLEKSDTFFITEYQGLDVSEITDLRAQLRNGDARLVVEKNTLVRVAAKEAGIEGLDKYLTGPTAIAFAFADPVAPAKTLNEMFKKRELPKIRALLMNGELLEGSRISDLADLPSWEELIAKIMGTIEAPITKLYAVIEAPIQEFIGTVDALAKKAEAGA